MKKANLKQKTNPFLLVILLAVLFFSSCQDDDLRIVPSTKITTIEAPVSGFSKLAVSSPFTVYVTFSETEESVLVESNENLHQAIDVKTNGDELQISILKNTQISGEAVLNVYIKTKSLDRIQAMGASAVLLQNTLARNTLELNLEGACILQGQLEVGELDANIIGASILDLSGSSNQFNVRAEGASSMTGFVFETDILNAYVYGASNMNLTVNQKLSVTASGASMVVYKGNGIIENQKLSDTSKIVHVD